MTNDLPEHSNLKLEQNAPVFEKQEIELKNIRRIYGKPDQTKILLRNLQKNVYEFMSSEEKEAKTNLFFDANFFMKRKHLKKSLSMQNLTIQNKRNYFLFGHATDFLYKNENYSRCTLCYGKQNAKVLNGETRHEKRSPIPVSSPQTQVINGIAEFPLAKTFELKKKLNYSKCPCCFWDKDRGQIFDFRANEEKTKSPIFKAKELETIDKHSSSSSKIAFVEKKKEKKNNFKETINKSAKKRINPKSENLIKQVAKKMPKNNQTEKLDEYLMRTKCSVPSNLIQNKNTLPVLVLKTDRRKKDEANIALDVQKVVRPKSQISTHQKIIKTEKQILCANTKLNAKTIDKVNIIKEKSVQRNTKIKSQLRIQSTLLYNFIRQKDIGSLLENKNVSNRYLETNQKSIESENKKMEHFPERKSSQNKIKIKHFSYFWSNRNQSLFQPKSIIKLELENESEKNQKKEKIRSVLYHCQMLENPKKNINVETNKDIQPPLFRVELKCDSGHFFQVKWEKINLNETQNDEKTEVAVKENENLKSDSVNIKKDSKMTDDLENSHSKETDFYNKEIFVQEFSNKDSLNNFQQNREKQSTLKDLSNFSMSRNSDALFSEFKMSSDFINNNAKIEFVKVFAKNKQEISPEIFQLDGKIDPSFFPRDGLKDPQIDIFRFENAELNQVRKSSPHSKENDTQKFPENYVKNPIDLTDFDSTSGLRLQNKPETILFPEKIDLGTSHVEETWLNGIVRETNLNSMYRSNKKFERKLEEIEFEYQFPFFKSDDDNQDAQMNGLVFQTEINVLGQVSKPPNDSETKPDQQHQNRTKLREETPITGENEMFVNEAENTQFEYFSPNLYSSHHPRKQNHENVVLQTLENSIGHNFDQMNQFKQQPSNILDMQFWKQKMGAQNFDQNIMKASKTDRESEMQEITAQTKINSIYGDQLGIPKHETQSRENPKFAPTLPQNSSENSLKKDFSESKNAIDQIPIKLDIEFTDLIFRSSQQEIDRNRSDLKVHTFENSIVYNIDEIARLKQTSKHDLNREENQLDLNFSGVNDNKLISSLKEFDTNLADQFAKTKINSIEFENSKEKPEVIQKISNFHTSKFSFSEKVPDFSFKRPAETISESGTSIIKKSDGANLFKSPSLYFQTQELENQQIGPMPIDKNTVNQTAPNLFVDKNKVEFSFNGPKKQNAEKSEDLKRKKGEKQAND